MKPSSNISSSASESHRLSRLLSWLDEYLLVILTGFLIAFIPLYPKLPLAEIIPGYLVRLRLEDVFLSITFLIWLIQIFRRKVRFATPLFLPIVLYAIVGLLSSVSAVVVTQTVPAEMLHFGKTILHYLRYLEYFSLYIIAASAIRSKKQVQVLMVIIVFTLVAVTFYGYGQKYRYWPVYSTMNREFAKGMRLVLTEHARVQSTFGGHYDLGGYLVIVLPLVLAMRYVVKRRTLKVLLALSYLGGLWLMVMTAARTSFFAYLVGSSLLITFHAFHVRKKLWQKVAHAFVALLLFALLNTSFLIIFGDNMYARLVQVIDSYPTVAKRYHEIEGSTIESYKAFVVRQQMLIGAFINDPESLFRPKRPENAIDLADVELTPTPVINADTQPSPAKPGDVVLDTPDYIQVATASADGTITYTTEEKPRTYSSSSLKYGLSLGIRLDTLWPRALQGYFSNPLLGSGYATLTKDSIGQFTEAESTDNNFLRTLGETGALGFVTFYGVLVLANVLAIRLVRNQELDPFTKWFAVGYMASTLGLLINAIYIDIFAASKVAFTYWGITGMLVALYILTQQEQTLVAQSPTTNSQSSKVISPKKNQTSLKKRRS